MFGFLNVYKPKGMTSHDVVALIRRISGIRQIGHAGTLDPFAEGVLPICIGKATRLIEYLEDDKAYIGTVQFGKSTNTYDIEGEISNFTDKKVQREEIEPALKFFKGEIIQKPPIYSAIKVKGKKLYEYARKGEVEIEIPSRKVFIHQLDIIEFDYDKQQLKLLIKCSKGTYIRSIANDLGERLGVFGHLIMLERIKAGKFYIEKAVLLNNLKSKLDIEKNIENPLNYLDLPTCEINNEEEEKINNGMNISIPLSDGLVILTYNKQIVAVGECNNKIFKCKKVFNNNC